MPDPWDGDEGQTHHVGDDCPGGHRDEWRAVLDEARETTEDVRVFGVAQRFAEALLAAAEECDKALLDSRLAQQQNRDLLTERDEARRSNDWLAETKAAIIRERDAALAKIERVRAAWNRLTKSPEFGKPGQWALADEVRRALEDTDET